MATDIIARGMITEYKSGTNIDFKENEDGSVTISASGDVSSEDTVARETIDNHKLDKNNPHNVTAEQVGLGNVNNTADLDKPISTAVQTALNDKANTKHTHKKSDITDFPNSLPANGGNADTVDGFGVAEYVTTLPEGEYYTEVARINTRHKKIESCDTSNLKVGLADYATNADHAMNAGTVNNHTVYSDVPANAVFTDTTNSDVTASGNPVIMDNLQGGIPFSEMVVSGKNLMPFPYYAGNSITDNGITFTVNADGTVTANGTVPTGKIAYFSITHLANDLLPGTKYTLSGCPEGGGSDKFSLYISERTNDDKSNGKYYLDYGDSITFEMGDYEKYNITIQIRSGVTVNNIVFRPQLELGDTATSYEPSITGRELQVNVSGKNLIEFVRKPNSTYYGVTFKANDDGSIRVTGTNTNDKRSWFFISYRNEDTAICVPKGKYVFSGIRSINEPLKSETFFFVIGIDKNGNEKWMNINKANQFALGELVNCKISMGFSIASGDTIDAVIYPQLEFGDTPTDFEPYHGSTITITPDSNSYIMPNDIRQQDGYNVVSISAGELSVTGVRKDAAIEKLYSNLKPVAFSGSYNDLSDKPEITASGNPIQMDNLQDGVPFSKMVISGKNLLTYPYNETTKTINGITFTDNGDGTITANGTATADAAFMMNRNFGFEKEGNYFLSGCPSGGGLNSFYINWYQNHTGVTQKNYNDYGSGRIIPYQHIFSENNTLAIVIIAGATVENLVFRPQLELGDTVTAYEPPITGRELTLAVSGKNLINNIQATGTVVGVTVTKNDDGTVTINGTTTGDLWLLFDDKCRVVKDKTYTFSMGFDTSVGIMFGVRSGDNAQSYLSTGTSGSFIAPETGICRIRGYAKSGITFDNLTIYPQLEIGSTATPYEPYNGTEYNITPTSNPYVIPNDIRQQEELNVVSVSAGELSVTGVRKNAAIEKLYNKLDNADDTYALKSLYGDTTINVGRKSGTTVGEHSTAEGYDTTASGSQSHAEGQSTAANGDYSHAEGINTIASGPASHAEGGNTTASGDYSHVEGNGTTASGSVSHAEGFKTTASNSYSHAEGLSGNLITKIISGYSTSTSNDDILSAWKTKKFSVAHGAYSHVEGENCLALESASHAEGRNTTASGSCSHAEGAGTVASGSYSHAEGSGTTASGPFSHAEGVHTTASNYASHVTGKFNADMTTGGTEVNTTGTAFVIGNGTSSSALSNAFSVQYDGTVKAKSTITASTTADYAEFFEWEDKNPDNEDRVGYFVTLNGDKIKIATNEDDYILGVVSGEPFVLGNGDCDTWNGMFLRDEFRRTIYEPAPKMVEILDSEGNPTGEYKEVEGEFEGTRPKLNPEYDNTQTYISRFERKEWAPIGMLGVLAVRHDGTAQVNGYVTVNANGIATACEKSAENAYRVIKSNTDSVVEIIFK